jgi:Response regulator containing a CheY-like receiver domain and an HTH DNA-binding domain
MLSVIRDFVRLYHGITGENAAFFLEHIDLLTPKEQRAYPVAGYLRALVYVNLLDLEKAEAALLDLERDLSGNDAPEARALLGDAYALLGAVHMMRNQEDFGDYYRKAVACLPDGTQLQKKRRMETRNNHNFSMADNRPGAKERMERAVHDGVPWISRFLGGSMSGMEHIFSAEAAYYSLRLDDARQHAYRAIYKAEGDAQYDLVCNARCILARIGLMRGDFAEMSGQIQNIVEYADRHRSGILKEIRDTALGWYYLKLRDPRRVPRSILTMDDPDRPMLARDRAQIVYAAYLVQAGEYAKLVGMLEYPQGLYLTRGIWPDRICLFIMLAIGHHALGNRDAAMDALWTAYDMSYHNGLTAFFVEGEERVRALVDVARQQRVHAFAPEWLDLVGRKTASFARRAAAVRAAYREQNPTREERNNPLTKRELEILRALAQGLTREEIAVDRFISVNTVKTYIRSIYNKLDVPNRAKAVSIAISRGYLDVSAPESCPLYGGREGGVR